MANHAKQFSQVFSVYLHFSLEKYLFTLLKLVLVIFNTVLSHSSLHSGPGFTYVYLFTSVVCVLYDSGRCTHAKSHTWRPEDSFVQLLLFFCVCVLLEIAFRPLDLCGTHSCCWFACHPHLETESCCVAQNDFELEILLSLSSEHRDDRCAPKSRLHFYYSI